MKRIAPWLLSATVHGAFFLAAIVTMTGVAAKGPEAPAPDAAYSVTIRPGGGPAIREMARFDDSGHAIPTVEATDFDEAPREAVDDLHLVRSGEREFAREGSGATSAARPPSPGFRNGSNVRLGSSEISDGKPRAAGGSGTGTGSGIGEGSDEGVEAVPLETPAPKYPETARREHLQGAVVLEVRIDALGRVESARVTEGSGSSVLDEAALAAVRSWTYSPATLKGQSVTSIRRVRLIFRLE